MLNRLPGLLNVTQNACCRVLSPGQICFLHLPQPLRFRSALHPPSTTTLHLNFHSLSTLIFGYATPSSGLSFLDCCHRLTACAMAFSICPIEVRPYYKDTDPFDIILTFITDQLHGCTSPF
jgi:hypothetical protein